MTNHATPASRRPDRGLWLPAAQLGALFVAVAVLSWPAIQDPPAWDAAMSIHPAAIWLSDHDFDLRELLRQPGYSQGGPNSHSISIVTWLTALAYWSLRDSGALFPVMHLAHFAVSALALCGVYRFALPVLGQGLAALLTAAVLVYPTVLAQTGCLYLEMPLLASTQWALVAWSHRRIWAAAACCLLSLYVKETGVILAGALAAAALAERTNWRTRLLRASIILLPVAAAIVLNGSASGAVGYTAPPYGDYLRYHLAGRAGTVPDLCAFVGLALCVIAARPRLTWRSLRGERSGHDVQNSSTAPVEIGAAYWMLLTFVGFYLVAGLAAPVYLLPRYFIQVIPCVFLALVASLNSVMNPRITIAVVALAIALFLANHHGRFYARNDTNDGSIAERSQEYRDLLQVQRQAALTLEKLPPQGPAFYGYPEYFLVNYPAMGFVRARPANGHFIFERPYSQAQLADFPALFYVCLDYAALGGERLMAVVSQATRQGWSIRKVGDFHQGRYRCLVMEVSAPAAAGGARRP